MRAIRVREFGEPEVMRLEETPDLEPAVNEILVRVCAVGVNPVDTYIRAGQYARRPPLPYTPGSDAAGVVEKTGAEIVKFKVGDRVYVAGTATGSYAEFCLCLETQIFPLPANVSFEQGAGVFVPYATAFRALFQKAKIKAGEIVLIHGATGGVGTAAIQLAKAAGARIVGTGGSERGRELILQQGANFALDHTAKNYLDEIIKITDGRGVDAVLEMLANVNLQKDLEILAMFGRIVIIGNRGLLEFNPRATMGKDAVIFGMSLFNAPAAEMAMIHENLVAGLANKSLSPVVGKVLPLAAANEAHRLVLKNNSFGKIVLIP
jgi:NADPH2:quinone reductase